MKTSWFPASLSSRLLTLFLVTALAAVLLMASLFSKGLGTQWRRAIVPHLFQYVEYIEADIGTPVDESRARALAKRLPIEIQVYNASGDTMVFTTRELPLKTDELQFFEPRRKRVGQPDSKRSDHESRTDAIRIGDNRRHPVVRVQTADNQIFIEFARPRSRDTGAVELLLAISGLALLLAFCYFLIKRLLRPIGQLQSTVQKISNGDLTARTNARGQDDLAALAKSVDQMSERIQQMLDAKRELLLAISHELRSPLTRARIATELLNKSKHQQKIITDIDEMETLIARLVESERLQSHVVLDKKLCDLRQLVDSTVANFDGNIKVHPARNTVENSVEASIDPIRIQVLLRNLLENALQHGKPTNNRDAVVNLHLSVTGAVVELRVIDNGDGIEEAHLSSVTEPFYRTDASRTRKTGGIGLGLYLSQRIAEAHGGTLTLENSGAGQNGVCVTVKLPVNDNSR